MLNHLANPHFINYHIFITEIMTVPLRDQANYEIGSISIIYMITHICLRVLYFLNIELW